MRSKKTGNAQNTSSRKNPPCCNHVAAEIKYRKFRRKPPPPAEVPESEDPDVHGYNTRRDFTAGGTTSSGGRIQPPTLNFGSRRDLTAAARFYCRRHNLFWRQDSAADTRFLGRGGIWLQNMGVVSSCLHRALCFPQHKSLPSPPPASAHPNPMSAPQTPLPILPTYPVPPYVYIETLLEANQHLQAILAGAVIGFDLEWVTLPNRPKLSRAGKKAKLRAEIRDASTFVVDWSQVEVCLAQIATHNSVYIINLRVIQDLPAELIRICEDPGILKVSVGIYSDGQQMWDSFRVNILSAVSLGLAGKLAYPNDILPDKPYANEPALGTIVRHVLQYDLSKELQTSPWDSVPLSDAQKEYAASDAHATFESYRVIDTAIASCGFPVSQDCHRQRIKAEELDLGDRKERARASDEKYRQKQREVLAWKQRMRRQNAYIAKYGMSAYVERCERERHQWL
ncbi:ribonuclease H-like domain-containing protein [Mycena haematopus]|nr:ribonuclease H-like domain-containing protein [Mycena haematopus]